MRGEIVSRWVFVLLVFIFLIGFSGGSETGVSEEGKVQDVEEKSEEVLVERDSEVYLDLDSFEAEQDSSGKAGEEVYVPLENVEDSSLKGSETGGSETEGGDSGDGFYVVLEEITGENAETSSDNSTVLNESGTDGGGDGNGESVSLSIEIVEAVEGEVSEVKDLVFEFNVEPEGSSCGFDLNGGVVEDEGGWKYTVNIEGDEIENGDYDWNFECSYGNESAGKSGSFSVNIDYTPVFSFSLSESEVFEGDSVDFHINISYPVSGLISYVLFFGDGGHDSFGPISGKDLEKVVSHTYSVEGSYNVEFSGFVIDGAKSKDFEAVKSVSVKTQDGNNGVDDADPEIDMIFPNNGQVFTGGSIDFRYKASDNIKVANCTFNLYFYNNSAIGILDFSQTDDDIQNGEENRISLTNFDEGDYDWEVVCYDDSGNMEDRLRSFSFNLGGNESAETSGGLELNESYEKKEEIEHLLRSINGFLVKGEGMSKEEKEAVEDLEIYENLNFYKKKLIQMRNDLQHNLDFMRDEQLRRERKSEILEEIDDIMEYVPVDVNVEDSYEYTKNGFDADIGEIVESYVETRNVVLRGKDKEAFIRQNEEIQNYVTISVRAKNVEIIHNDSSEEIALIVKEVKIKNESFDKLIEVIPKEIAEDVEDIEFLNDYSVLEEDPMVEIELDDLIDGKIVYYVEGFADLKEIEKTNSVVFEEDLPIRKIGGITGLVVFGGEGGKSIWFYFSWIIFITGFIFVLAVGVRNYRVSGYKRNKDVRRILMIAGRIKESLEEKEVERAKKLYSKVGEHYASLPEDCKSFAYGKIKAVKREIDKKDVSQLVKECISAIKEGRKKDAMVIYGNIQKIYDRLPRKFREKVFKKLKPYIDTI